MQALQLYASVVCRLREPGITEIIDNGGELVPALAERLTLTRAQLRALREAAPPEQRRVATTLRTYTNIPCAICWPMPCRCINGRAAAAPGSTRPGGAPHGKQMSELTLIRADYYGDDATTVRDAIRSVKEDLLNPLLGEIAEQSGTGTRQTDFQLCTLIEPVLEQEQLDRDRLAHVQNLLACIRRALVGERGPGHFSKRRVSGIAGPRR